MNSPGEPAEHKARRALLAGLLLLLVDGVLTWYGVGYGLRVGTALVIAFGAARLCVQSPELTFAPWRPALGHTCRVLAICGLICGALLAAAILLIRANGWRFPIEPRNVSRVQDFVPFLWRAVLIAPLAEELIYRGLAQPFLRTGLGSRWAIFVSGIAFWIYHWLSYGAITPLNHLIGGWIIAWSYERSRSLLTPILLHAIGNLSIGLMDLSYLHWPERVHAILGWNQP